MTNKNKDIMGCKINPKVGEWWWFLPISGNGPYLEGQIRKITPDYCLFDIPPTRGIWFGHLKLRSVDRPKTKRRPK